MIRLFLALFILLPFTALTQSKKPRVLVYGNGADAYAAAIQSAQSGVNTLWVTDADKIGGQLTDSSGIRQITSNQHLDAGIWAVFMQKMLRAPKATDSVSMAVKNHFNLQIAENVFNQTVDTVKNLTLIRNKQVSSIKKSGKGWNITLSNRQRFKVRAVVDATTATVLYDMIEGQKRRNGLIPVEYIFSTSDSPDNYQRNLYRTSVAAGESSGNVFHVPFDALMPDSLNNYFATRNLEGISAMLTGGPNDLPIFMFTGQAVGAAAAYCAFFNTTIDKISMRTLQGELLTYGSALVAFQDIGHDDDHYGAIQRIGATGLLKGRFEPRNREKLFCFSPDSIVSVAELEPIVKQLYTRSQIWFSDHKDTVALTLKDLLGLIKYTANRGAELDAEVEKGWEKRFKFAGKYNPDGQVSRRQVAVLMDAYLKPFSVRVDRKGNFQY